MIEYKPKFAEITKTVKSGIFLSHLWEMFHEGYTGWQSKTLKNWKEEIGLSIHDLKVARSVLSNLKIFEGRRIGNTWEYQINPERVYQLGGKDFSTEVQYDPDLTKLAGGVNAGLFLSFLWQESHNDSKWVNLSMNEISSKTALTIQSILTVRKNLDRRGLILEKKKAGKICYLHQLSRSI